MRALTFAPEIMETAKDLTHSILHKGPIHNAVHLRLEEDILTGSNLGGIEGVQTAYLATLSQAGYNASTPVYIANGLSRAEDPDGTAAKVCTRSY